MIKMFLLRFIVLYLVFKTNFVAAYSDEKIIHYKDLDIYNYRRVSSIQYIYFEVPEDTISFTWNLVLNKSSSGCSEPDVSILAQYGSFPVSHTLDQSFYPPNLLPNRTMTYNSTLSQSPTTIANPIHGQWFIGAVMPRDNNQIIKNLLASKCEYGIFGNITFRGTNVETISSTQISTLTFNKTHNYYRFQVSSKATIRVDVELSDCQLHNSNLTIQFESGALPNSNGLSLNRPTALQCDSTTSQKVSVFAPRVEEWVYVLVTRTIEKDAKIPSLKLSISSEECVTGVLRKHRGAIPCYVTTTLKATQHPDEVQSSVFSFSDASPETMLVPRQHVTMTTFEIDRIRDVGGFLTLSFELTPISRSFSKVLKGFEARICVQRGDPPISRSLQLECRNKRALIVFNAKNMVEKIRIAYPEPGLYYIGYQDFSLNNTNHYRPPNNENITTNTTSDDGDIGYMLALEADLGKCKCQNNGKCLQTLKGPFIISACKCMAHAKGITCADTSEMVSKGLQLFYTLLLTLSNLAFVPAIIVSFKRWYYTQCLIYSLNMFFSTAYHACDMNSWSVYGYCIMDYGTMQYSDFLLSVLSFWFTLMAMSRIRSGYLLVFSTLGVIVAAILMENNSVGAWNSGVPIGTGILLVAATWARQWYKTKRLYPSKKDYFWTIPGLCLAFIGIIIFVAVENDTNYPFTHSFWHVSVAFSVPFMLPRYRGVWKMTIVDGFLPLTDKNSATERENEVESLPNL